MYTLLALTPHVGDLLATSFVTDSILAAPSSGAGLANAIRNFIAPIFLLAISIAALSFLFQRQITQFFQFVALAIGVAVFFYVPGIVEGLARLIAKTVA